MADASAGRQRVLLFVLLVLVLVAGWWYRDVFMPRAVERKTAGLTITDPKIQLLAQLPDIPVHRTGGAEEYTPKRNLFDFAPDPVALEAEKRRREKQKKLAQERKKKEQERRARAKVRKRGDAVPGKKSLPPPPSFSYTYVGYARPVADERGFIAFLVKKGARTPHPIAVRVGDIVEEKFVVKRIDLDQVVIGYTDERYRGRTKAVKLVPKRTSGKKR